MSSPRFRSKFKDALAGLQQSQASADTISQKLRSEVIFFAIVVVIMVVASFLFQVGDWLDLALAHQEYGIDEIIVIAVILSIILTIFLIRRWSDLSQAVATRALAL